MRMIHVGCAAALLAGGAVAVSAQESGNSKALGSSDQWVQQIGQLFQKADDNLKAKGFAPASWLVTGALQPGGSQRWQIDLSGKAAVIVGQCDTDCSDMDLKLVDASGNVVAQDVEADDVPIVQSSGTGRYAVVVTMVKCSAAPCRYGVKQYTK